MNKIISNRLLGKRALVTAARLVEIAKVAFTEKGGAASLDEIARAAGVGPGTLYHHFPTRDCCLKRFITSRP